MCQREEEEEEEKEIERKKNKIRRCCHPSTFMHVSIFLRTCRTFKLESRMVEWHFCIILWNRDSLVCFYVIIRYIVCVFV